MQQQALQQRPGDHAAHSGGKNHKVVYTIVTRERDGQKFWLRVGAAFRNRDGSINIKLDAMPTNGELQIRDQRPDRVGRAPGGPGPDGDELGRAGRPGAH